MPPARALHVIALLHIDGTSWRRHAVLIRRRLGWPATRLALERPGTAVPACARLIRERVEPMRWSTLGILICAAGSAVAQPADSIVATRSLLQACRALVENAPTGDMMQIGA